MAIAYYYNNDLSKLYINIIKNFECTNHCVFCDKPELELLSSTELFLEKVPTIEEIVNSVGTEITAKVNELIFCGLGEPTLYLDTLLNSAKALREKYDIPLRLNTNGQAYLIYPERKEIPNELKKAGFKIVSISLNAISNKEYNNFHHSDYENPFESIVKFIQDCNIIGLKTYVSFIEFRNFKRANALNFIKKCGLKENNLKFRKYIKM